MKTMSKQMISFLLAILLCFSVLPMPALATTGEAVADDPQQTEELQQQANSGIPEDTESPAWNPPPRRGLRLTRSLHRHPRLRLTLKALRKHP